MLSDGYDIVSHIADTSHSQVYIVRHRLLDQLRIAKIFECNDMRIMQEADIIKLLRHPGIPQIYDIIKDSNSICIIEEYIAGKSLSAYCKEYKPSYIQILDIAIQICNILEYIHNYENTGIIHMDLKPDNIMIDGNNNIRIIDFDNSVFNGQNVKQCYGSVGFAAPEQFFGAGIDMTADIYSFGMVLLYMVQECHIQSKDLYHVINKCIRHNPFQRFRKVKNIRKELEGLLKQSEENKQSVHNKSQKIYIHAMRHGIGATHISLCLSSYIARNGYKVLCIGNGYQNDLISEIVKGIPQEDGTFLLNGISIIFKDSNNIQYNLKEYDYVVYDCGTAAINNKKNEAGINIMITDIGYRWMQQRCIISGLSDDIIIAVNHSDGDTFYRTIKESGISNRCVRIPCIYRWYEKNELFDKMAWDILSEDFPGAFAISQKNNKNMWCLQIKTKLISLIQLIRTFKMSLKMKNKDKSQVL